MVKIKVKFVMILFDVLRLSIRLVVTAGWEGGREEGLVMISPARS